MILTTISSAIVALTSNPLFVLGGFIIGLFSFLGMIYFYTKSKEERIPCYFIKSTNVFQDLNVKFDALKVSYNEEIIDNLTVTTLFFWNSGKKTIRDVDIAQNDPLILTIKDGYKILNIKLLNNSSKKNNYKTELASDSLSAKLMFDYIEKDEGMIVQLTHNGSSSHDVNLSGAIIGSKKIINKNTPSSQLSSIVMNYFGFLQKDMPSKYSRPLIFGIFIVSGMTYVIGAILSWFPVINESTPADKTASALFFVAGVLLMIVGFYSLKRIIPKDFQSIYDDIEYL